MHQLPTPLMTAGYVTLGVFVMGYIRWLWLPVLQEARSLMALRQQSQWLSQQIDQGVILIDSPEYWQAIEKVAELGRNANIHRLPSPFPTGEDSY